MLYGHLWTLPARATVKKFWTLGWLRFNHPLKRSRILDGLLRPNNYYQCILDRMPGTTADDAANAISAKCLKESPLGAPIQKQTGFFAAFHSGSECTFKKIKDTASPLAKQIIQYCCYSLYQTGSSNQ